MVTRAWWHHQWHPGKLKSPWHDRRGDKAQPRASQGANPRLPEQALRATLEFLTKTQEILEKLHQIPLTSQRELKAQANCSSNLLPDRITSLPSHSQPAGAREAACSVLVPCFHSRLSEHLQPRGASISIQIPILFPQEEHSES